jgi:hypothetical protein
MYARVTKIDKMETFIQVIVTKNQYIKTFKML